jgi:hypothetical protein
MFTATVMRHESAPNPIAGSHQPCSGRFDGNAQPLRGLAHALVEAQQSEADDRGTHHEQRCEVDGIERPNRVAGKRLTRDRLSRRRFATRANKQQSR